MIDKLVAGYRKMQMGLISGLSGDTAAVLDETSFYDVGYMQTQIERIKKELKRVTDDLSMQIEVNDNSDYGKKHKTELMQKRERLLSHMVFLASNSFSNLDSCVKLADGHNWGFMSCVHGLQEYHAGHKDNAFQLLEAYYRQHGNVEEHFLINKVFGLLLAEKGQYQKAIPFLTYALQFVPDDVECLERLKLCYQQDGNADRVAIIDEVLSVLG